MIVSYSIISAVLLGCGYLSYRFVMAGERQHSFNRTFILMVYAMALIAPFFILALMLRHPVSPSQGAIEIGELTQVAGPVREAQAEGLYGYLTSANVLTWIWRIYLIGVALMAANTLVGWFMLWRLTRKGERIDCGDYILILTDDQATAPFSWRNMMVMSRKDYAEAGVMILRHEEAHLRHLHSADLLLAQFVLCLQWFNPAAWALREELKVTHEFQADDAVIRSGADIKEYQLLLIKKAVGSRFQSLANSLSHSKLKKRVTMMYKKETSRGRRLAALIAIPALLAGCALISVPAVAGVIESFARSEASAPASDEKKAREGEVYQAVEVQAEPQGGMTGLMEFLRDNIKYPEEAYKANIQGRVIVKFVIETDGSISDAQVIKGVDPLLDAEAIRVVEAMPKWTPGKVKGKPVASWFNLPVSFKLQSEPKKDTSDSK